MNAAQPPQLASWLLRRLAGGSKRDSLIGDLDEQFVRGRSASWYWRQVLSAILVGAAADLRDHKLLAVRAVVVGWAVLIPWFYFTIAVYRRVPLWVGRDTWIPGAWQNADAVSLRMAWWAWWIYEVPLVIAWCGGALIIGWVIARLHREHQAAVVVRVRGISTAVDGSMGLACLAQRPNRACWHCLCVSEPCASGAHPRWHADLHPARWHLERRSGACSTHLTVSLPGPRPRATAIR